MCKSNNAKAGFTIVEVAIVLPIVALVLITLISSTLGIINRVSEANTITRRSADLQRALDTIEQDMSYSVGFAAKVECPKQHEWWCSGGERELVNGQWQYQLIGMIRPDGTKAFLLKTLLTDRNPLLGDPGIKLIHKYKADAPICSLNPPAFGFAVYYFHNGNLIRKFASNEAPDFSSYNYPCGEPWQKESCREYACPEQDKILLRDAELEVNFFSDVNPNIPLENLYNPSLSDQERQAILDKASTIEIVLKSKVVNIKGDKPTIVSGRLRANRIP